MQSPLLADKQNDGHYTSEHTRNKYCPKHSCSIY